jgi:hypothetical protein
MVSNDELSADLSTVTVLANQESLHVLTATALVASARWPGHAEAATSEPRSMSRSVLEQTRN